MLIQIIPEVTAVVRAYSRSPKAVAISLLDETLGFIRRLTAHEMYVLASAGKITAKVDRYGNLENVRLRRGVSSKVASRILSPLQVGACKQITKRRQGNGNKRWVPHFDKSDGGLTSSHRRLVFPIGHPQCRYSQEQA